MRIMILTNLFPPFVRGGAERIAERQALLLAQAGHEVQVISTSPDGNPKEDHPVPRLTLYRFRPRTIYHVFKDAGQPFWKRIIWHVEDAFGFYPRSIVEGAIRTFKPDIVITHNMKGFGLQAFRAIQASGVSHLHVLHDLQLLIPSGLLIAGEENGWQVSGIFVQLYQWFTRRCVGNPAMVVAPSEYLLQEHRTRGFFANSRLQRVLHPAPWGDETFSPSSKESSGVVCVSQLEPHKGLFELLEAWKSLSIPLTIVGSGTLEPLVMEAVKQSKNITYLGRLSPVKVRDVVSRANLFVMPSRCYENAPTVILEALSLGVPVVATRIGGIPEMVDEAHGRLVAPNDSQALANTVKDLYEHPLLRTWDREPYSTKRYAHAILAIVESLKK